MKFKKVFIYLIALIYLSSCGTNVTEEEVSRAGEEARFRLIDYKEMDFLLYQYTFIDDVTGEFIFSIYKLTDKVGVCLYSERLNRIEVEHDNKRID